MSMLDKLKNRLEEVNEIKDANGETRAERRERLEKSNEVFCPKCLSTMYRAIKEDGSLLLEC